jgi:AcrR family transcriptional regulator
MVRPRLDAPVPELNLAPALDGVRSLLGDQIGTRERMVLLAIDEMLKHGPADFNARVVCERLGLQQSMVPYHFASRDGLVVEATIWAFRDWARNGIEALRRTTGNGERRLRAYVKAEIDWATRMGPIALLVQYPMLSEPVRIQLESSYGPEMRRQLEYHLAVLTDMVIDIRTGSINPLDYDESRLPGTDFAVKNSSEFLAATSISWACHGIQMWASGSHLSTQSFWSLDLPKIAVNFSIKNHIDEIVSIAKGR